MASIGDSLRATRKDSFACFDLSGDDTITKQELLDSLDQNGFRRDDPRLKETMAAFSKLKPSSPITFSEFKSATAENSTLVDRVLLGETTIPAWQDFSNTVENIFESVQSECTHGANSDYIPQLLDVNPDKFAVAVCTVDGQRLGFGCVNDNFTLQALFMPLNYCIAMDTVGEEQVHSLVGYEPSGRAPEDLALNERNLPFNPFTNSGSLVCCSMIKPEENMATRAEYLADTFQALAGGTRPGFSNNSYLSEKKRADRNYCIAYMLREKGLLKDSASLADTLEVYFQVNAMESTCDALACVAATLANGGQCPVTSTRVFGVDSVTSTVAMMYSCGMAKYSGKFAFEVGLPAKASSSGAVMVVIPNVMGICIYSPKLDEFRNSARGIDFCQRLTAVYNFHSFDVFTDNKINPRRGLTREMEWARMMLLYAASEGSLKEVKRMAAFGVPLDEADYDGRTALHLAAANGHESVVDFLLNKHVNPLPMDRWGRTPEKDAQMGGHDSTVAVLLRVQGLRKSMGAISEKLARKPPSNSPTGTAKKNIITNKWQAVAEKALTQAREERGAVRKQQANGSKTSKKSSASPLGTPREEGKKTSKKSSVSPGSLKEDGKTSKKRAASPLGAPREDGKKILKSSCSPREDAKRKKARDGAIHRSAPASSRDLKERHSVAEMPLTPKQLKAAKRSTSTETSAERGSTRRRTPPSWYKQGRSIDLSHSVTTPNRRSFFPPQWEDSNDTNIYTDDDSNEEFEAEIAIEDALQPLTVSDLLAVRKTWKELCNHDDADTMFMEHLNRDVVALFREHASHFSQGRELTAMFNPIIERIDPHSSVVPAPEEFQLMDMGRRHHDDYGLHALNGSSEPYEHIGEALLWTLGQALGSTFTHDMALSWVKFYTFVATNMRDFDQLPPPATPASPQKMQYEKFESPRRVTPRPVDTNEKEDDYSYYTD